jgi:hypothetical protein
MTDEVERVRKEADVGSKEELYWHFPGETERN